MSGGLYFFPGFQPATDAGLFDHGADAIFNTVNCLGTGKGSRGVAGQVFTRFPEVHDAYMAACKAADPARRLKPGGVLPVEINPGSGEREKGGGLFVVNVATKDDWRQDSRMPWIEAIAGKMEAIAARTGAKRFALPPFGCGEGGLDWKRQVGPMLRPHLEALAARGVEVLVFAEDPAPERGGAVSVPRADNLRGASVVPPGPLSVAGAGSRGAAAPVVPARPRQDHDGAQAVAARSLASMAPEEAREARLAAARREMDGAFDARPVRGWFAGVGARPWTEEKPTGAPPGIVRMMEEISGKLAQAGFGLRSGAAEGADMACQKGVLWHKGVAQIFLPQRRFNGFEPDRSTFFHIESPLLVEEANRYTRLLHPTGARLSGFARGAMDRNAFQAYGPALETSWSPATAGDPFARSSFMLVYTNQGKEIGGSGHAIRLAKHAGLPVINLGLEAWRKNPDAVLEAAEAYVKGEPFEAPKVRPAPRRVGDER